MTATEIAATAGVGKTALGMLRGPEANLKDKAEAVQITQNVELSPPFLIAGLLFAFGPPLAAGWQLLSEDVDTSRFMGGLNLSSLPWLRPVNGPSGIGAVATNEQAPPLDPGTPARQRR